MQQPDRATTTPAFAYLRRLPGMGNEAIGQTLKELFARAEEHGCALAGVFFEERIGDRLRVWCELVAACRSEHVVIVVAPGGEHFHHDPVVAAFMREELATTIRGAVLLVDEVGTATAGTAAPDAR